jgi:hypothetical protein
MKPYTVTAEVTTRWTLVVHGEDEVAITKQVEHMDSTQIENAGDYVETVKVEATDIELVYPEDEEEPEVEEEETPEEALEETPEEELDEEDTDEE